MVLTDILPTGAQSVSISFDGGASYTPWNGVYTIPILVSGDNETLTVRYSIDSSTTISEFINKATVVSAILDPDTINNTSTVTIPLSSSADVFVNKISTNVPQLLGDTVSYDIVVGNLGPSDSTSVVLYDTLCDCITLSEYSLNGGISWNAWNTSLSLNNILPNSLTTISIRGILASMPNNNNLLNIASAYGRTDDPNLNNNTSSVNSVIQNSADLSISKIFTPLNPIAGETITYNIVVNNAGPSNAQNVVITDAVASNILNQEFSLNSSIYEPWISPLTISSIDANETITLSIRGIISQDTTEQITNTAIVRSSTPDPYPGNNTSTTITTVTTSADVYVINTITQVPAIPGDTVTYFITVGNNGQSNAQNVVLYDTLVNDIKLSEYSFDGGVTWDEWKGSIELGQIVINSKIEMLLRGILVSIPSGGVLVNTASAYGTTFDPNLSNNVSQVETFIGDPADLSITKTSSPNPVDMGSELIYTITVINNGPSSAQNVIVYDENINYLSNVQYSINNGLTWDRWNGSYSIGTMTNGQINTILIRGFVYDSGAQYIKNKAYISSSTYDPNPNNNTVITYTKIRTCTDVGICQYCRENLLVVSEMAQFALKVFNNGPNNASNIIIKDDVSSFLYNPEYSIDCGVTWNTYKGSITISDLYRCNSIDILIRGIAIFTGNNYITNTATVYSDNEDCNTCNNTSQKVIKLISYYC